MVGVQGSRGPGVQGFGGLAAHLVRPQVQLTLDVQCGQLGQRPAQGVARHQEARPQLPP